MLAGLTARHLAEWNAVLALENDPDLYGKIQAGDRLNRSELDRRLAARVRRQNGIRVRRRYTASGGFRRRR